jgi:predicted phage terminase large subunit-like protein
MGRAGPHFYVIDVVRGQWSAGQRNAVIRQTTALDAASYPRYAVWVEQEPGSGGKESAQNTIAELAGYDVHAEPVTGSKVVRAAPFAAQCEAGNVFLVAGAWNAAYLNELCAFPAGPNDDQVDGSSGAFNKLALPEPEEVVIFYEDDDAYMPSY